MQTDLIAANPELSAVAILVLGAVAASLLRTFVQRGLESLDRLLSRATTGELGVVTPGLIRAAKSITFWIVIFLALALALRLFGADDLAFGLAPVVAFLPKLVAGVVIIGSGHLLGLLSRSLVVRLGEALQPRSAPARLAYWSVMVIAIVMGLQQMQVDISFLTQLLLVLIGVLGAGMMLAFALGSRQQVANVMAQGFVRRFTIGEHIRIGEVEGTVSEIHATGVELTTHEGSASIPAAHFAELPVIRISPQGDADE